MAIRIKHTIDKHHSNNQDISRNKNITKGALISYYELNIPLLQSSRSQHMVVDSVLKCKARNVCSTNTGQKRNMNIWHSDFPLIGPRLQQILRYFFMFCEWKKRRRRREFFTTFQQISTKDSKDPNLVTKFNLFRTHIYYSDLKFILCWFGLF